MCVCSKKKKYIYIKQQRYIISMGRRWSPAASYKRPGAPPPPRRYVSSASRTDIFTIRCQLRWWRKKRRCFDPRRYMIYKIDIVI